jgi:glutamine synthetase
MESLGELRRRAYLAVKRSEAAAFAGTEAAYECFEHFTKM